MAGAVLRTAETTPNLVIIKLYSERNAVLHRRLFYRRKYVGLFDLVFLGVNAAANLLFDLEAEHFSRYLCEISDLKETFNFKQPLKWLKFYFTTELLRKKNARPRGHVGRRGHCRVPRR